MAQMAGRASVEFYVGLALKARGEKQVVTEDAFVIRAFRNGLGVFVSKFVFISLCMLSRILMVDSSQTGHRRTGDIQARDTV
jgi:exosome complex exonuclease DIS3/RRP44